MKKLVIVYFILTIVSCKSKEEQKEITQVEPTVTLEKGCYGYLENNAKIIMEITETEGSINANLSYAIDGKDSNTGVFSGKIEGDKLFGVYTFSSEGTESKRELAFLVKDNELIEGYGSLNDTGTAFKDKENINYTSTMPLSRMDCTTLIETCLYENGESYSTLKESCVELGTIEITLNPLENGAKIEGNPAHLIFDETLTNAEVFLPGHNTGIVLEKNETGNWITQEYTLISWKGYVLQKDGQPIFGGE